MPLVDLRERPLSSQKSFDARSVSPTHCDNFVDVVIVPAIGAPIEEVRRRVSHSAPPYHKNIYERLDSARIRIHEFDLDDSLWESKECLFKYANKLLAEIVHWREQSSSHGPIHFVGHSTGGLVVKAALVEARKSGQFSSVWQSCNTVAFFGVPHGGSSILSDGPFALSIQRNLNLGKRMSQNLRAVLAPENETLRFLATDFASVARKMRRIWTFVESADSSLENLASSSTAGDTKVMVRFPIVDSRAAILRISNEVVKQLPCEHAQLLDMENHASSYIDGLKEILDQLSSPTDDLANTIKQNIVIDLHLFHNAGGDAENSSIKVWSVYPSLEKLLKVGPRQCFRDRLSPSPDNHSKMDLKPPNERRQSVPIRPAYTRRPSITPAETLDEVNEEGSEEKLPSIVVRPPTPPHENEGPQAVKFFNTPFPKRGTSATNTKPIPLEDGTRPRSGSTPSLDPLFELGHSKGRQLELALLEHYRSRQQNGGIFKLPDPSQQRFRWIHVPCNVASFVPEVMQCLTIDKEGLHLHDTLLDEANFDAQQTVARHGGPHSRHMRSGCMRFSPRSLATPLCPTVAQNNSQGHQFCIFLPYLHWDSFASLIERNALMKERSEQRNIHPIKTSLNSLEHQLIWQFMGDNDSLPVHQRRSLDSFGYPNLRSVDARDHDQVLFKRRSCATISFPNLDPLDTQNDYGRGALNSSKRKVTIDDDEGGKVLMVDQLWCWICDPSTVLTFFSPKELETRDKEGSMLADLRSAIYNDVNGDPRFASKCETVEDFAALVVWHAIKVMLENMVDRDLQVFRVFEEYISVLTEMHTKSFKEFSHAYDSGRMATPRESAALNRKQTADLAALLELRDVEDELNTLEKLFRAQIRVIDGMKREYEDLGLARSCGYGKLLECLEKVKQYSEIATEMKTDCSSAQAAFTGLLDLKQKQASIFEATAAREASDTAAEQSRAVMIFTVFTIIFLPLSFFTGLFGVNTSSWTGIQQPLALHEIVLIMFPVSAAVTVFALMVAFNNTYRGKLLKLYRAVASWLKTEREIDLESGIKFGRAWNHGARPSVYESLARASGPAALMATKAWRDSVWLKEGEKME